MHCSITDGYQKPDHGEAPDGLIVSERLAGLSTHEAREWLADALFDDCPGSDHDFLTELLRLFHSAGGARCLVKEPSKLAAFLSVFECAVQRAGDNYQAQNPHLEVSQ